MEWILRFLGRLHPLLVHFPIGLLTVALFFEWATLGGRRPGLRLGIRWMVYTGASLSVLTALLGWLLGTYDDYTGQLVLNHRNAGIATALLAGVTALCLHSVKIGRLRDLRPYRFTLVATVLSLAVAGHLGASMTHGEDYLTGVFPGRDDAYGESTTLLAELGTADSLSDLQRDRLNLQVRAIFAHNCYQCHSDNKHKGNLVLEHKEGVFQGGESGPVIVPGNSDQSELYRRISLGADHEDVMPRKGKVLPREEIDLIKLWIDSGAHWADQALKVFPEAPLTLNAPDLPKSEEAHPIDRWVDVYFADQDIDWPKMVDDRTFIRRAYLDIIGLLPEPRLIEAFLANGRPGKRTALIDSLLADSEGYTQHWLSFWNDLLRNDYSGTGFITGGRKQITDWLYTALRTNKPYTRMVDELIDPSDGSEGFIKGIQWRGVVNASQSTEMQAAQNIGQSLLGVNVKCASCHNSFVSNLTLEQSYGFASIFADSLLELNRCDQPLGKMAQVGFLYPELGEIRADSVEGRLQELAEIIVKPENGRLFRTLANRYWGRLMGRGLVEPVDEMDNPPWNADILDWIAADFRDSGADLKHLIRRIMTSKAYQLALHRPETKDVLGGQYVFQGPLPRRLSAEQFSDAVSQVVAPVYTAQAYDPNGERLAATRIWHREIKFDRDVLPEPGRRYFRKSLSLPDIPISQARLLVSVDHSYVLYINGKRIGQGSDWTKVDRYDVTDYLTSGENCIAFEGTNEGTIANPAGLLFSIKIALGNGREINIHSDRTWKSSARTPEEHWTLPGYNDLDWNEVRDFGNTHWGHLVAFTFDQDTRDFARASLVRQHSFLKALGRPTRENVTTTRNGQATLLQALELTNGSFFNERLGEGAMDWLGRYGPQSERIVDSLYWKALGRSPTGDEQALLLQALGPTPTMETVQDVFWSTLMLPEFQFIP